jgi:type II secretory pathway component PulK
MSEPKTPAPAQPAPAPKTSKKRRGVVLVAVLVVVASLSLVGYHYADMMTSEFKASNNAHKTVQARKFAESGIHYAAAMLSNPDNYSTVLGSNPWNNPGAFQSKEIKGGTDNVVVGYFSIVAPPDLDDADLTTPYYGVADEGGKINLNALMKSDVTGKLAHDVLVNLPNMTEEIANNIVAWMGGTVGIQNGGAPNDYYMSMSPGYRSKSGPIDSIDELLLIKGVTIDLLYGSDANRNGAQDNAKESQGPSGIGFERGWSAYLTVHSREPNVNDPTTGVAYVYLNNTDMTQLSAALSDGQLSDDMAKFILMYRQNGPYKAPSPPQGGKPNPTASTKPGKLSDYQIDLTSKAPNKINSIFDLVNAQVSITTPDPNDKKKTITTIYSSPLYDTSQLADQLPKLFALATVFDPTALPEIPARVNINTASRAVLTCIPGLSAADVDKIATTRPPRISTDPPAEIFNTPAWLITEAQLDPKTLSALKLDKYITTRSQVYRVQSVGYFDGKGPAIRVEAVIDTNSGRPRIIAWRDLTELGKGWNEYVPTPSP